eukprot:3134553-Pleurochrysis_carterae.AAC.1
MEIWILRRLSLEAISAFERQKNRGVGVSVFGETVSLLEFAANGLGPDGIITLAETLKVNETLTTLNVEGARSLARVRAD